MNSTTYPRSVAELTKCEFPNCTGDGHEDNVAPSQWLHNLSPDSFDNGLITGDIYIVGGVAMGEVDLAGSYTESPSDELRAAADKYEAFPTWLRSLADKIDAHNAAVQS